MSREIDRLTTFHPRNSRIPDGRVVLYRGGKEMKFVGKKRTVFVWQDGHFAVPYVRVPVLEAFKTNHGGGRFGGGGVSKESRRRAKKKNGYH